MSIPNMPSMPNMPANPQEAVQAMQAQALDAIRNGQAATLEAIKRWNEGMSQYSATMPAGMTTGVPGAAEMTEDMKKAFGQPEQIVDSVYDFAAKLLELNKQFVHQLLEASTPKK